MATLQNFVDQQLEGKENFIKPNQANILNKLDVVDYDYLNPVITEKKEELLEEKEKPKKVAKTKKR